MRGARLRRLAFVAISLAGCGGKPPPRTCSIEAPPKEDHGPLEIGMCTMDAPDAAAPDAPAADATNDGG